jgi:hypothetical protein
MRQKTKPAAGPWTTFLVLAGLVMPVCTAAQGTKPEDDVRASIIAFQKGVEAGDRSVALGLAAESPFRSSFLSLFDSLAQGYSKLHMAFPVEIGHIKILSDGRAKAETYLNPGRDLFVFTLVKEGGRWKFYHLEGIRFPIYDDPATPAGSLLTLPQDKVKWMICEAETALSNRTYFRLKELGGEKAARDFFISGEGFRAAMDAWLPFLEGAAQFAVFYGILEENYYGSKYTLAKATKEEAMIRFAPLQELEVMKIAYFTPKMSMEEYQKLYADILRAQAGACGLTVEVTFDGTACTLEVREMTGRR